MVGKNTGSADFGIVRDTDFRIETQARRGASALGGHAVSRVIHQDVAHHLRGDAEKGVIGILHQGDGVLAILSGKAVQRDNRIALGRRRITGREQQQDSECHSHMGDYYIKRSQTRCAVQRACPYSPNFTAPSIRPPATSPENS